MRFARSTLAFAIVAALAWFPLGASAAGFALTRDAGGAHAHVHMASGMTSADAAMDDCCPDGAKSSPSHHNDGKCPMGACCVTPSFLALADDAVRIDLIPARVERLALPADQVLSRIGGSPPFRPPRA